MPHDHDPTLTDDELDTWSAFATVLEWLPPALDAPLSAGFELTHFEYGLLYALADAPERTLRLSVLADYANSSLTRLSRAVSRLEARGWVRREPDPSDGRSTLAVLTLEGLTRFDDATPAHLATLQQVIFDPLTKAQQRQLTQISRRIATAIRQQPGWRPTANAPAPGRAGESSA